MCKYDLDDIFEECRKVASKSPCKYKVGVLLIDDRGKIVASGFNHFSEGSKRLGQRTIHAEVDAISKGIMKPSNNLTAFIFRGKYGNKIHPCPTCSALLKSYGIRTVYCTNEDSWAKIEPGQTLEDAE